MRAATASPAHHNHHHHHRGRVDKVDKLVCPRRDGARRVTTLRKERRSVWSGDLGLRTEARWGRGPLRQLPTQSLLPTSARRLRPRPASVSQSVRDISLAKEIGADAVAGVRNCWLVAGSRSLLARTW